MPTPLKIRNRLLGRDSSSDESGFVLVFVLILSVALITMLTFAVTSSVGNLTNSANYSNITQAKNSAMTGLSTATDQMTTAGSVANLPCTVGTSTAPIPMLVPEVSNTNDAYSVAIVYSVAGVASTCTGPGAATYGATGAFPTSAVLTSTGTTAHTTPVTMQETMVIDATSSLLAPFTYAMFSQKTFTLQNGLTIQSPTGASANVYGGTLNDCQNTAVVDGNVQVADPVTTTTTTLTIGNKCVVTGDLYVNGSVILNNKARVDGSIHAYGGDVTLNDSTSVGGNIYATGPDGAGVGGDINIDTSLLNPIVGGSLFAATTVTATIGGVVQDVQNQLPLEGVAGVGNTYAVNFPVASSSMPAAPAAQTFPQLSPTAATLAASVGDSSGDLYNVVTITGSTQPDCTNAFMTAAQTTTYTMPTAIYAPNCVVSPPTGTNTFNLPNNEIWVVAGFNENGGMTVQSGVTGKTFDLSVVVPIGSACPVWPATGLGDLTFTGNTFAASINVSLYTPCDVTFTGDQIMDGQILAGGNVTTTGNFTLNFNNSEDAYLPGTQGASPPTSLVTSKTVTNG